MSCANYFVYRRAGLANSEWCHRGQRLLLSFVNAINDTNYSQQRPVSSLYDRFIPGYQRHLKTTLKSVDRHYVI